MPPAAGDAACTHGAVGAANPQGTRDPGSVGNNRTIEIVSEV